MRRLWEFVSSGNHSRILGLLAILIIVAAVPLTVLFVQNTKQTQTIRQHAAPSSINIVDTFNRLDNSTSMGYAETPANQYQWISIPSNRIWGINNNTAYPLDFCSGTEHDSYSVIDAGITNAEMSIKLTKATFGTRIVFRLKDVDNFYFIELNTNPYYILRKKVGGVSTDLLNPNPPIQANDGDILKIKLMDQNIQIYINDQLKMTATDGDLTGTKFGIGSFCANDMRFDDFSLTASVEVTATPTQSAQGSAKFPCVDTNCAFDTRFIAIYPDGAGTEGITVGNKWYSWHIDKAGVYTFGSSGNLSDVERWKSSNKGPCSDTTCKFDTRFIAIYPDGAGTEGITVGNKWYSWHIDKAGVYTFGSSGDLTAVDRWKGNDGETKYAGPCGTNGTANSDCKFDTRVIEIDPDGAGTERITVGNKWYTWDIDKSGVYSFGSSGNLSDVGRWKGASDLTPTSSQNPSPTGTTGGSFYLLFSLFTNSAPKTTTRDLSVCLYDTKTIPNPDPTDPCNKGILLSNKTLTFKADTHCPKGLSCFTSDDLNFDSDVSGKPIPSGTYQVYVKTPRFLRRRIIGSLPLPIPATFQVTNLPTPIPGDINGDNALDAKDWNILASCFKADGGIATTCTNTNADINDDGNVDMTDAQILIDAFAVQHGD